MIAERSIALCLACFLLGACRSDPGRSEPTDAERIEALTRRYERAFLEEDLELFFECVTEDFVAVSPGEAPVTGWDRLRRRIAADLAAMDVLELRFDHSDLVLEGDRARVEGHSAVRLRTSESPEPVRRRGVYEWRLRRDPGGRWLLARDESAAVEPEQP